MCKETRILWYTICAGGETNSSIAPEQSQADTDRALPQIGKKWRRADTNVVAIKFDQLKKPSNMHTGDAVSCQRCHAMMSHLSGIREDGEEQVSLRQSVFGGSSGHNFLLT